GVLIFMTAPRAAATPSPDSLPTFAAVQRVIETRCLQCHSPNPTITELGTVPAGVYFDEPTKIAAFADKIKLRTVDTQTMPPVNKTGMTEEERMLLGRWIAGGARIEGP
ncbi:MAG: hypothetical protein V4760_04595, partial [Bdellovibrionota bacterium]